MMNAFDSIAQAVADNGCTRVFGVPGGGPNLDLIGAFNRRGIEFVLAHTERSRHRTVRREPDSTPSATPWGLPRPHSSVTR